MKHTSRLFVLTVFLAAAAWAAAPARAATGAPPITVPFDHMASGFELDGVHRDIPCEACHIDAIFRGTPRDCGTCHIQGATFNATPKTFTHMPTTNQCAACHDTASFRPSIHFDHAQVMGRCAGCHNGGIAQGEGPTHPPTSQDCASCHTVLAWNPPKAVDHSQIPLAVAGYCIICHNGVQAAGQSPGHIPTKLECGDCHTTSTWLGADFDHTGIRSACASCHNGIKAVGKQANHMPTTDVCENCHTTGLGTRTPNWVPSSFDHTQMAVSTCQTCHSGTVRISSGFVPGQPTNHVPPIPAAIDCGICHGNVPSAETWTVLAASIATLHTGLPVSNCLQCHAGETFAGAPAPYVPMSMSGVSPAKKTPLAPPHIPVLVGTDCSACHGAAYQAGGFGPATAMSAAKHAFVSSTCDTCHDTGKSFYVGGGTPLQLRPADHVNSSDARMATGDCSLCHETKDWTSTAMPAGHMPNPANSTCAQCHASAPGDYTPATLAAVSALHAGITGDCGLCHGGTSTALTWFNQFTPKDAMLAPAHIPYLAGTDCSSCHAKNYVAGGFGPMNMTPATHAFVPTACATCHEAGLSFTMGGANPPLQGRPADHTQGQQVAPNDCSLCHTTANWISTVMPTGHMPNPGNQGCAVCHTAAPSSYGTLASIAVLHTGITGNCGQCHGATAPLSFYNNNDNPKDGVLTPAHIPYLTGTDCSACHAPNYTAGGFGPTGMNAAKHAFVPTTCDTCHEANLSFYLGASTPPLQGRPSDHMAPTGTPQQQTGDCSGCHNTATWASTALPAGHMPNPGNQQCTVCHTAAPGSYATLAANAVLHTGISTGCAQCHGGSVALTFYNNNDNPKSAVLSPPHIPAFNGTDCSSCHAPSTYAVGAFGPMNMTQATHAGVGSSCNPCHEAGLKFTMGAASPGLQGRPVDHTAGQQAAPNDCTLCHTTANWISTVPPTGHMPNPAGQSCNVCHTAAPANYAALAGIAVLHTGITGGCGQCHGGTAPLTFYNNNDNPKDAVLTPAHIPYLAGTDCGACHAQNYVAGGFGPMNMTQATHAFAPTACVTCHEAGLSLYMGAASPALQGRPADHTAGQMVAPNDCSLCHTTANWNSTALPAGHMPNPGNQGCSVCHTAAPANYATLAANAVLHTGITSGCLTCHGAPNASPPVFYLNYTPKDAVLSPVHIPTGSTPCEDCHAVSFTSFGGTTMSASKHTAMFGFIGNTCDACHNAVSPALSFYGVTNLTTRPSNHNSGSKKTSDCSSCHNPNSWNGGAATRKALAATATRGTVTAVITPATSPAAAALSATGGGRAIPAGLSHAGVTGHCSGCHDGALAAGKDGAHIASNAACENCHTTRAWLPARFEHQGISASCASCHNGIAAPGKPAKHVQTMKDCSVCHGTLVWSPALFDHLGVNAACSSCHNSITATGKQAAHPATMLDCAACHATVSWTTISPPPARRPSPSSPRGTFMSPNK